MNDVLGFISSGIYLWMGLGAIRGWLRTRRAEATRWAALAFGLLAAMSVQSTAFRAAGVEAPSWLAKATLVLLPAFPYCLYRLSRTFTARRPVILVLANALTVLASSIPLLLPVDAAAGGAPSLSTIVYLVALVVQWSVLSVVTAVNLWRGGRGLAALRRRRMRLLSAGAVGLCVAILLASAFRSEGAQAVVQVIAILSAASFMLGMFPPKLLRIFWQTPERQKVEEAALLLMSSTAVADTSRILLTAAVNMVGALRAWLLDRDDVPLASSETRMSGLVEIELGDAPEGALQKISVGTTATLVVAMSQNAALFGLEEITLLRYVASLAALAFERAALSEAQQEGHAELERLNADLTAEVTERLRTEEDVKSARVEADQANHAKSEFLSAMSHELRTPLNSILGFGQLLTMDELDAKQLENVGHIIKAGRHLLDLINEVLDISRIEAGMMSLSVEPVEIAALVADALNLVQPMADERRISLASEIVDDRMYVLADRQRLNQVLLNLLSNGVKYNRAGGRLSVTAGTAEPNQVRIGVSDTGYGIPADRMDDLFTPFERLGAEAGAVQGTGLGLALSRRLVELMGGVITVQSEVDAGTTFWLHLQRADVVTKPPVELQIDEQGRREEDRIVLYVEDNLANLRLLEGVVAKRPHIQLLSAMQGGLGIDLAEQHQPDLILLDLHLPDRAGQDVLADLKRHPRTRHIPVVILSADATPGQVQRLLRAGAVEYLTKPVDVHRLLSLLDELVTAPAKRTGGESGRSR